MKFFSVFLVALLLFVQLSHSNGQNNIIPASEADPVDGAIIPDPRVTILSQMRNDPELEVFTRLLPEAGVDENLGKNTGRGTVFAPTDSVIAQFVRQITSFQIEVRDDDPDSIIQALLIGLSNIAKVDNNELPNQQQLIRYHILGDAYPLMELKEGNPTTGDLNWSTLSGMNLTFDSVEDIIIDKDDTQNTSFISKNIFCTNGWVHKINTVLVPYNLTDVLLRLPEFVSPTPSVSPSASPTFGSVASPSPSIGASPVAVSTDEETNPTDEGGNGDATDTPTGNGDVTETPTNSDNPITNGDSTDTPTGDGTTGSGDGDDETSPSPDLTSDDGVCFPGSARVMTSDKKYMRMDELTAGTQVVHNAKLDSSSIFLFTHRSAHKKQQQFVRISTACGHSVTMTKSHYLRCPLGNLIAAGSVRVGDKLSTVSGDCLVKDIETVVEDGLYAPHSMHGDLVVGGVVVSGYSKAIHPRLAHALLSPVRWLVRNTGIVEPLGRLFDNGANLLLHAIPSGNDRH